MTTRPGERPRVWTYSTVACAAGLVVVLACMAVDDRTLHGVSVWSKPAKFWLSFLVYAGTLALLAPLLPRRYFSSTEGGTIAFIAVVAGAFELAYITHQAAHGEMSHFNISSRFHATMYQLMGVGAVLLVTACLWLGVRILHRHGWRNPYALSAGLGLVLTFVLGGGFGGYLGNHMSHWVGGSASDAGGLPLVGWSRDGGDLRVAHFFGMHAMQALPLLGLIASRTLPPGIAVGAVFAGAVMWSALSVGTFMQALAGRPVV